jgi:hypothetical protein
MERIIFYEDTHSYLYKGRKLTSGTSFVKVFEPEFPRDYYLDRGAAKELLGEKKYKKLREQWRSYGRKIMNNDFINFLLDHVDPIDFIAARQELSESWDSKTEKACRKGTEYHLSRESASYERGVEYNEFDELEYPVFIKEQCPEGDNCSLAENMYELQDGYYPELLVHCIEHKGTVIDLCGQSDRVFIGTKKNGKRYIDIGDFKTNSVLKRFAMKDEDTGKPLTMMAPISHLQSHHITKYGLQLSLYAWMMEQHGFEVRHLGITHINELHKLPYYRKEIEAMVNYWKKNFNKKA